MVDIWLSANKKKKKVGPRIFTQRTASIKKENGCATLRWSMKGLYVR